MADLQPLTGLRLRPEAPPQAAPEVHGLRPQQLEIITYQLRGFTLKHHLLRYWFGLYQGGPPDENGLRVTACGLIWEAGRWAFVELARFPWLDADNCKNCLRSLEAGSLGYTGRMALQPRTVFP